MHELNPALAQISFSLMRLRSALLHFMAFRSIPMSMSPESGFFPVEPSRNISSPGG